jgi:hypothetical protein
VFPHFPRNTNGSHLTIPTTIFDVDGVATAVDEGSGGGREVGERRRRFGGGRASRAAGFI